MSFHTLSRSSEPVPRVSLPIHGPSTIAAPSGYPNDVTSPDAFHVIQVSSAASASATQKVHNSKPETRNFLAPAPGGSSGSSSANGANGSSGSPGLGGLGLYASAC